MRIGLKVAILQSGQSQREIGAQTRIPEARLSSIIRGWTEPRDDERVALQRCLDIPETAFISTGGDLETRSRR